MVRFFSFVPTHYKRFIRHLLILIVYKRFYEVSFSIENPCKRSTCYRSVPGGDSSELIVAAQEGGIPHPPGYPLLAILLKLWNYFVPPEYIAFSSALLNSFIAALCNTALYTLIEDATSPAVGILGSGDRQRFSARFSVFADFWGDDFRPKI